MQVTIVVLDGLVMRDGVGYRGLDLSSVAVGRRELPPVPAPVVELVPGPKVEPVEGQPVVEAVEALEPEPALAPEPVAPLYLATAVQAVQWSGASGWVEESDPDGQPLPNRAITSLDEFAPALEAWQVAHAAATKPHVPTMSEIRARGLQEVDQQHQATLLQLTGNPTEAERNTWAGKVELSRRVLAGETLALDQESFLAASGLDTPGARKAYATEVMTNSARYWTLVGMADKVRREAKARILSVQTMAGWEACGKANRAAAAEALAAALALMDKGAV